jgi:glycosyltransferase involved in cell wall biosynthesis
MALSKVSQRELTDNLTLWTYRGLVVTPIFLKLRHGCHWVMDIRAPLVKQDIEFQQLRGNLGIVRLCYYYTMYVVYRLVIRLTDKTVVVSPALKEFVTDRYPLDAEEVYVQTLGVDTERFRPSDIGTFDQESVSIVLLSSVSIYRGIDTLIEMLSLLAQEGARPDLHILGSGRKEAIKMFQELSEQRSVDGQITWHGDVDHQQVPRMLNRYDIAVSPLPDTESYSLSSPAKIFEYLAMSRVVVASDIRCHRELIDDGENGLLVAPDDANEWAETVQRVCSNPAHASVKRQGEC